MGWLPRHALFRCDVYETASTARRAAVDQETAMFVTPARVNGTPVAKFWPLSS
jgi:hypothetical protein